jgi:hypothetical protein
MRRFIINSPKFQGNAEVFYTEGGILCKIDLTQCVMSEMIIHHFKCSVPPTLIRLLEGKAFSEETTIVEAEFIITFDMFWTAYGKKINRLRCEKLWSQLNKMDHVKAFHGIPFYDGFLKINKWRTKADPEKYLKDMMWENEWS